MKLPVKRIATGACILFLVITAFTIHKEIPTELPPTALYPYGRSLLNKDHNLELISSAVHFGFSFEGKDQIHRIIITCNMNWMVFIKNG
jgi:hypothetical protein